MALIGQTAEIAPADRKIYALRDATSTVENIGLICASIMSKKLAEGIDALVLDVKTGSGAFMRKEEDSVALAEVMVDTAKRKQATVRHKAQAPNHPWKAPISPAAAAARAAAAGPHSFTR